jgi:hypothetical protein
MVLPPSKDSLSGCGVGGPALAATLRKLLVLSTRCRLNGAGNEGVGSGGSMGAINTRPAIRETLCLEDRRLGLGRVGERDRGGGRVAGDSKEAPGVGGLGDAGLDGFGVQDCGEA